MNTHSRFQKDLEMAIFNFFNQALVLIFLKETRRTICEILLFCHEQEY